MIIITNSNNTIIKVYSKDVTTTNNNNNDNINERRRQDQDVVAAAVGLDEAEPAGVAHAPMLNIMLFVHVDELTCQRWCVGAQPASKWGYEEALDDLRRICSAYAMWASCV